MIYAYLVLGIWIVALIFTIINLLDTRRLRAADAPSRFPLVSVVIPARNEAAQIEETMRRFLSQTYRQLEVIVVDDRSSDGTGAVARQIGAHDPRVVVVDGEELPTDWLGKPWAMEQGARRANGELLLFVDADVSYQPTALAALVAFREQTSADLVSFMPELRMESLWEHVLMPQFACFIFRFLPLFIANRSRVPSLALGGGVGILVRRTTYEANGRHTALRNAVIDDVGLAQLVRKRAGVTRMGRAEDLVSVRMYRGGREIVSGFTKNAFAVFGSYLVVMLILGLQLAIHVVPYVLAATGVVRLTVSSTIAPIETLSLGIVALISATRVVLFRSFGYRLDNALVGEAPMILGWCFILARSTWLVGVRGRLEWRGRRYAGSSRFGAD